MISMLLMPPIAAAITTALSVALAAVGLAFTSVRAAGR